MKIGLLSKTPDNYSNSRLIEEAAKRDIEVLPIDYSHCDLIIDPLHPDIFYKGESLKHLDAVVPRVGLIKSTYGMAVIRQFEALNIYCLNSSLGISRARDKMRTLQLLAQKNLPFPSSAVANDSMAGPKLLHHVGGVPTVMKLTEGMQGKGTVLAETENSAKSIIEAFSMMNTNLILQRFIKESKGTDIRAFVLNGKVVASISRSSEDDFRSNLHLGGKAITIKLTPKEREIAVKAAKEFKLNMAGIDILRSDDGPLILEVNACPGLEGVEKTTGTNIAEKIVEFLIEHSEQVKTKPNYHKKTSL
ncbi:MAG: RimK family alpha-L-glutamate ligase [Bdellovibrionota bacterium]|nr:RimK family alpha-L-glutamate ligase [Bdellovibrionota bacterium]